jgi:hypothetical protein
LELILILFRVLKGYFAGDEGNGCTIRHHECLSLL